VSGVIDQGRWGTCGFVSVLNSLYEDGQVKEFGSNLTLNAIHTRLAVEVLEYLRTIEQQNPELAAEIVEFSGKLGGRARTIGELCLDIRARVVDADSTGGLAQAWEGVVVAMPPHGILDYLKRIGLQAVEKPSPFTLTAATLSGFRNCVVGVGNTDPPYDYISLKHWVFVNRKGVMLNWAERLDLTTEALPPRDEFPFEFICWVIQIK
jgi:hypothetical protein